MNTAQIKTALQQPGANVQQLALELVGQIESLVKQFDSMNAQHVALTKAYNDLKTAYGMHSHGFWTTDPNGKELALQQGQMVVVPAPRNQFHTAIGLANAGEGAVVKLSRPV
jgi:hypothetical protein